MAIALAQQDLDAADCRCPLFPYQSTDNKNVRIRCKPGLSQWITNYRLRVRDTAMGRLFVQQVMEFPGGEHDDGPDCANMLIALNDELLT